MVHRGQIYKHYKGNLYLVLEVATHTETKEELVIYCNVKNKAQIWARPLKMFENEFDLKDIKELLAHSQGITIVDDIEHEKYPIATEATGQDKVLVGRIRRDFSITNGLNFWCVADNIRKGAASNAIQIVCKLIDFSK